MGPVAVGVPLRPWANTGSRWSAYAEAPPRPGLVDVVVCTWTGSPGWARDLRVLPDGCIDLVWNGQRLSVVIPAAAPLRVPVPETGTTVGLRLRCGVGASVLGISVADLPHGPTRLADVWPEAQRAEAQLAAGEGVAVLERLVNMRLAAGHEPDRRILAAARLLGSAERASSVASGLSDRGLRRKFHDEIGHGPKHVHRILRFQRFLRRLPDLAARRTSLAVVAADLGYTDQSHLGRECVRLAGSTPRELVRAFGRNIPDRAAGRAPR